MNFNKFLKSLFGDKSVRDMKLIQPLVEEVKKVYPEIEVLSNDELRAKTKEIQKYVQDSAREKKEKIEELKATIAAAASAQTGEEKYKLIATFGDIFQQKHRLHRCEHTDAAC